MQRWHRMAFYDMFIYKYHFSLSARNGRCEPDFIVIAGIK